MDDLLERIHPRWYRDVARMTLERPTFEWVDSGGVDSADLDAFSDWRILPRVLATGQTAPV